MFSLLNQLRTSFCVWKYPRGGVMTPLLRDLCFTVDNISKIFSILNFFFTDIKVQNNY